MGTLGPAGPGGVASFELRILLDRGSIEVFGNDGRVAISRVLAPSGERPGLSLTLPASGPPVVVQVDPHSRARIGLEMMPARPRREWISRFFFGVIGGEVIEPDVAGPGDLHGHVSFCVPSGISTTPSYFFQSCVTGGAPSSFGPMYAAQWWDHSSFAIDE